MLTEGRMPPERFARWLRESADKLRMIRDMIRKEVEDGHLPESALEAPDVATVLSLLDPLTAALGRVAKRVKTKASA